MSSSRIPQTMISADSSEKELPRTKVKSIESPCKYIFWGKIVTWKTMWDTLFSSLSRGDNNCNFFPLRKNKEGPLGKARSRKMSMLGSPSIGSSAVKTNNHYAFEKIFKPVYFLGAVLGMSPYNVTDGELVLSKLKATLSMTLVVFNVVLTVLYFQSFADNFDIDFAKADTIKFLTIFRDLGGTTIMAITLMFSYVNSKHMLREVGLIYQVDSELMKLNFENDLEESERKIKKQLAILLVVLNFVFNVVGEVGSAMVRTNHRILYLLVNIYPRLVITLLNLTLYSIFTVIQTRFEMINVAIYQKVVKSNVVRKYPNELDFSDQITQLVSIHKILVTVSRNINSIFSFQILLCITVNFVLLIGDLHTSMYIIFFRIFTKHYKIVLDMIKNCITYGFDLFYLARRTSELCNEANRTKVVLLGIKIDVDKENERNTVIVSALKLIQNKLEITACRLFNIDNALLFSICGAASSYLFIMLQLDIGNRGQSNSTTTESSYATVL
ncbi:hypothetical protein GEV33_008146 [Tenebrio molitor]|uniref:Gustatory receptor n=1 Tax=Tenebrio molitor TaxID=7067 RepID=A0A8J6HHW3_TENMO|nr:hypothetical protein GEV33_008146 [Tenebrio molitor]